MFMSLFAEAQRLNPLVLLATRQPHTLYASARLNVSEGSPSIDGDNRKEQDYC